VKRLSDLNAVELQNLRHLIGASSASAKEFNLFAQQCSDQQLKTFLQNSAAKAEQNCRTLLNFLQA